jgi:hypothetical protein
MLNAGHEASMSAGLPFLGLALLAPARQGR